MNAYKQTFTLALLASILGASVASPSMAADLTAVRATNEMGHTRVVLDMQGLPDGWSSIYNEKAQQLKVHLPATTNKTTGPVQYNNRTSGVLKGVGLVATDEGLDMSLAVNQDVRYHIFTLAQPDRVVLDLFNNYEQRTTKLLKPGVTHTQWDTSTDTGRVKVDVLEIAPTEPVNLVANLPEANTLQNMGPTGSIVVGLLSAGENMGTDFSKMTKGTVKTTSGKEIPIVTEAGIAPEATIRYIPNQGYTFSLQAKQLQLTEGASTYTISGVNRPRGANELIAYTNRYGTATGTNVYGQEVTIRDNVVVAKNQANSEIPVGDIVLSAHGTMIPVLQNLAVGDTVDLEIVQPVATISKAGTSLYETNQIVLRDFVVTRFEEGRYRGRTLLGVKADGTLVVLLATGNYRAYTGITGAQGGAMLKQFGAINGIDVGLNRDNDIFANDSYLHRDMTSSGPAYYERAIIFP